MGWVQVNGYAGTMEGWLMKGSEKNGYEWLER